MSIRPLGSSALIERYSGLATYNALTVMSIVRPETFSARMQIYIQQASGGTSADILKIDTDGKLLLHTASMGTSAKGSTVLSAGQQYHVTFVRDGNNRTVYLDGFPELTLNTAQTWAKVGEGLLGHWGEATGAFSQSAVKIWSAVLSQSEIQAEMGGYEAVRTSGLNTVSRLLNPSSLGNEVSGGVGWTANGSIEEGEPPSFSGGGGGGGGGGSALGNVAIIGDSLMRGWLGNPDGSGSAPIYSPGNRLKELLEADGYTLTYVGTEGPYMDPGGWDVTAIGGWTIPNVNSKNSAVAALSPDVVIVSIGTNDLGNPASGIGTTITNYLNALEAAVGAIPIFVFVPVKLSWFNTTDYNSLRSAIVSWCAGAGNRYFGDLDAAGMNIGGADGNGDGTHWSATGANTKIAPYMFGVIDAALGAPGAPGGFLLRLLMAR